MSECKWYEVGCHMAWLRDELHAFALWCYDSILNGLAVTVEAIPVPDFLLGVTTQALPSGVAFFVNALELPVGLSIIVSAYIARFILRRIPLIG